MGGKQEVQSSPRYPEEISRFVSGGRTFLCIEIVRSAGRQDTYSFSHKEPVTRSQSFSHQVGGHSNGNAGRDPYGSAENQYGFCYTQLLVWQLIILYVDHVALETILVPPQHLLHKQHMKLECSLRQERSLTKGTSTDDAFVFSCLGYSRTLLTVHTAFFAGSIYGKLRIRPCSISGADYKEIGGFDESSELFSFNKSIWIRELVEAPKSPSRIQAL
ncbi:hypothetical protein V6N13_058292 [Hibiscus sabdariffa]|uniref:Uncharacterized protein n=1 Tax=Hibiscus sabdariffa TaxID=183260 RepID=A0ABR2GGK8_9ROSI